MNKISVNVYADEVIGQTVEHLDKDNESWIYSGILLIQSSLEEKIIHDLNEFSRPEVFF